MIKDGHWDYTEDGCMVQTYGGEKTYQVAFDMLSSSCRSVEDWGSGYGYFKATYGNKLPISNVDSAMGANVDISCDLSDRSPESDGVLLRHILEHNPDSWLKIVRNACVAHELVIVCFLNPKEPLFVPDRIVTEAIPEDVLLDLLWAEGFSVYRRTVDEPSGFPAGHQTFNTEWVYHAREK